VCRFNLSFRESYVENLKASLKCSECIVVITFIIPASIQVGTQISYPSIPKESTLLAEEVFDIIITKPSLLFDQSFRDGFGPSEPVLIANISVETVFTIPVAFSTPAPTPAPSLYATLAPIPVLTPGPPNPKFRVDVSFLLTFAQSRSKPKVVEKCDILTVRIAKLASVTQPQVTCAQVKPKRKQIFSFMVTFKSGYNDVDKFVRMLNRGTLKTKTSTFNVSNVKQDPGVTTSSPTPSPDFDCFTQGKVSCTSISCVWDQRRKTCFPKKITCKDLDSSRCKAVQVIGKCVWREKSKKCLKAKIKCDNKKKNDCTLFEKFGDCVWESGKCSSLVK